MALDLRAAFKVSNEIRKNLLSDYVKLKFIGINKSLPTKPRIYLGTVAKNWFYRTEKNPDTGEVEEIVTFVPSNDNQSLWAEQCTMLEVVRKDNTFLRLVKTTRLKPSPPSYQWRFLVRPNAQDTEAI
jgi:hypothetical protein